MAQRSGIHRILEIPIFYNIFQKIFFHRETLLQWNKLIEKNRTGVVLDVGCGPGNMSINFKDSKAYIGLDISEVYINKAKQLYGEFGEFHILSATEIDQLPHSNFDLVVLSGVFHHLSDNQAEEFLEKIVEKLSKNGVLVTVDPTYINGRYVANFFASHDRGMHVRTSSELLAITSKYLKTIDCEVVKQKLPPYQRVMLKLGKFE